MGTAAAIGGMGLALQAVGMISGANAQRRASQADARASRLQGEYEVANADYDVIVLRRMRGRPDCKASMKLRMRTTTLSCCGSAWRRRSGRNGPDMAQAA